MMTRKPQPLATPASLTALDGDPVNQNQDTLAQIGSNEYGQPPMGGNRDWDRYFALLASKNATIDPKGAPGFDDVNLANNPNWWLNGMSGAQATPKNDIAAEDANEQMMPTAVRPMYRGQVLKQWDAAPSPIQSRQTGYMGS